MPGTYMFRDAQHKKDCLIQSIELSRQVFAKNPPKNQRETLDALLYLGMIYVIENTMTKKVTGGTKSRDKQWERLSPEPEEARSFLKTQTKLRKTADKFFEDPTRTTLWLSGI